MITVMIEPRADGRYDMRVGDEGDQFVNSNQGYENAEDCIAIARRLWPPIQLPTGDGLKWSVNLGDGDQLTEIPNDILRGAVELVAANTERVVMRVTYRDGKTHTEQLR